jgi:hypothetical protein
MYKSILVLGLSALAVAAPGWSSEATEWATTTSPVAVVSTTAYSSSVWAQSWSSATIPYSTTGEPFPLSFLFETRLGIKNLGFGLFGYSYTCIETILTNAHSDRSPRLDPILQRPPSPDLPKHRVKLELRRPRPRRRLNHQRRPCFLASPHPNHRDLRRCCRPC